MEPISGPAQPLQCTQIPELITEVEYRAQSPSQLHLCYFCGFFIWQSHKHHSSPSPYTAVLVHPAPANGEAKVHNRGQDGAKPLPGRCHHWSILCKASAMPGGLWVSGASPDFSSHADRPGHIPWCRGILPWCGVLRGCSQHPVSLETLVYQGSSVLICC